MSPVLPGEGDGFIYGIFGNNIKVRGRPCSWLIYLNYEKMLYPNNYYSFYLTKINSPYYSKSYLH